MIRTRSESLGGRDELGDPNAPMDSPAWCRAVFQEALGAKHDAQSRVGRLAISIRSLRDADRWSMLADLDGEPFLTWEDFCQYPEPYGLGLSPDQVEAILDRSNAGKRLSAVLGEHGTNQHTRRQDLTRSSPPSGQGGNSVGYLEARLRRSHPEIAAALDRGEFPTVKAAARKAGIVKPPDAGRQLAKAWAAATPEQRAACVARKAAAVHEPNGLERLRQAWRDTWDAWHHVSEDERAAFMADHPDEMRQLRQLLDGLRR